MQRGIIATIVLGILCFAFVLKATKAVNIVDGGCIQVWELPLVAESQHCYDLAKDFFYVTRGAPPVVLNNVYDVQVNFLNHSITVNDKTVETVIFVTNSSHVELNAPRLFSVAGSVHAISFGVRIECACNARFDSCDHVWIHDAWIIGFFWGIMRYFACGD